MAKIEISIIRDICFKIKSDSIHGEYANMNHSIFILLQNVSVKNNRLEFCFIMISSESGLLHRLSIFSSESPTEITEKLSEWVSQGQLMDTTMTISKLEYVDRTRQLNIVCGVNSIQDWRKSTKIFSPRKLLFSFCHYEWLYDSFFYIR